MRFFINRNFALLFGGRFISQLGDILFDTTLSLWIVTQLARGQGWAPAALGGVLLAALLPVLLFGSVAGVFADRWNKRRTMLSMDAIRVVLVALLLCITDFISLPFPITVVTKLIILYIVVFLCSTCAQLFNPSSFAFLGNIVVEEKLARASGLLQTSSGITMILGPLLATTIFFAVGAPITIALNAFSFLLSFLSVLMMHTPPEKTEAVSRPQQTFLREYTEGLRFLLGNPVLRAVMIGALLAVVAEGAQQALGIFFYQKNLQAPLSLYGIIPGSAGAGFVVGSLLAALLGQRLRVGRLFSLALLLNGICMILYSRSTSLILACMALFSISLLVAAVNVAVNPLALYVTPREMIGRIAAMAASMLSIASTITIVLASNLASTAFQKFHASLLGLTFGPFDTIFLVAGIITVIGAFYTIPHLWHIQIVNRNDNPQEEELQTTEAAEV